MSSSSLLTLPCHTYNYTRPRAKESTLAVLSEMVSPTVNRSPTGKEHLIAGFLGGLIPTGQ